ncbi:MFS transporter [Actinokineospora auranticolor]|uniref:MFS transporter n=1 Tax=Actinokineospora auranticolor TaxID=155976 RepID=UPI0015E2A4DB|nr:MFS transporter [Actinokineospora auranticolor]
MSADGGVVTGRVGVAERGAVARAGEISSFWLPVLTAPVAMGSNAPGLVLKAMSGDLGVGIPEVTWVVTTFGLGMAVGTPLAGHLIRRRGTATTLVVGTVLTLLGALIVGFGPSLPVLVAGRLVQALGGVALMVLAINAAHTPGRAGLVSVSAGVGGAIGPVAGLLVAEATTWHLSLALSALNLVAVPALARQLPARPDNAARGRFDYVGAVLFTVAVSALVLATHFSVALVAVVATAVPLVFWVRRRPAGFLPLEIVRNRVYVGSSLAILVLAVAYFFLLYHVPALLRTVAGWGDTHIGLTQLVVILTGSLSALLITANYDRIGRARVITGIALLAAVAQAVALLGGVSPLLPALALGIAVLTAVAGQATLMVTGIGAVAPEHRPVAVGLFTLCFQLGGAFGPMFAALLT